MTEQNEIQQQITTANKLLARLRVEDRGAIVTCAIREDVESPAFYLSTRLDIHEGVTRRSFPCHATSPVAVMLKVLAELKAAHDQGHDLVFDGNTVHLYPIINGL